MLISIENKITAIFTYNYLVIVRFFLLFKIYFKPKQLIKLLLTYSHVLGSHISPYCLNMFLKAAFLFLLFAFSVLLTSMSVG